MIILEPQSAKQQITSPLQTEKKKEKESKKKPRTVRHIIIVRASSFVQRVSSSSVESTLSAFPRLGTRFSWLGIYRRSGPISG